jgi:hypothetical protein
MYALLLLLLLLLLHRGGDVMELQAPVLQGLGFKCGSVNIDVKAAQQLVVRRSFCRDVVSSSF